MVWLFFVNSNVRKSEITPERLQEIFLNIAQKYADEFLQSFRKDACFIGRYSDDRNGSCLTFKGGALDVPYDDVARLERYVRVVKEK